MPAGRAAVPAYELVGDDAEATYVHSSTEDQVESYAFEPVPVDRRVAFAAARPVVRKTDAGTRSIILRVDSLGELAESGALALSTSGVRLCRVWEADPETGGLWAPARLGVAHFGARVPHPQSLSAGPNSGPDRDGQRTTERVVSVIRARLLHLASAGSPCPRSRSGFCSRKSSKLYTQPPG